jgi:hypothetical protein
MQLKTSFTKQSSCIIYSRCKKKYSRKWQRKNVQLIRSSGVVRATATPKLINTNPPAEIEQRV